MVAVPFEPDWESLQRYEAPDWFRDAKFGIYAHWGIYSVPQGSGNTDWYGRNMYQAGHPNRIEHERKFGPVSEFGYKDLVPFFTAPEFDADEWADLFVEAGARFAGPVGEHADGFSMWNSKVNPWNAAAMGPKRDIVGELEQAVRKRGLKFLVSMHHQWLWGWYPTWDSKTDAGDPANAGFYGPSLPPTARFLQVGDRADGNLFAYPLPSPEWQAKWLAKVKEVITGYSPDLLWFDNRMQLISEDIRREMVAYYYNYADGTGFDPVLTYKLPDLMTGTATVDLERSRMPEIYPDPWLTDTSVSSGSWAYARDLEIYSTNRLVDDLVDIVSKNGCLLLNIAPHPDGTIPELQKDRLREIGRWLRTNGEAIYGSRPWLVHGEGPTRTAVGHLADLEFKGFGSRDIRFTTNNGYLYAIALGRPEAGFLVIHSLGLSKYSGHISDVELVGCDNPVSWKRTATGLEIRFPEDLPGEYAWVFRISR